MGTDKLARDMKAAEAAGMSYGRWRAMQPHEEPEPPKQGDKICERCGQPYFGGKRSRYCKTCVGLAKSQAMKRIHAERERAKEGA